MASLSRHPFKRLLAYGRRYRRKAWLAGLCSVLNTVFDLAPPALIGLAIDIVVDQQTSALARWGITDLAIAVYCTFGADLCGLDFGVCVSVCLRAAVA